MSPMELQKPLMMFLLLIAGPNTLLAGLAAPCQVRKVDFEISRKMLVQQEMAEKDGHQPWRSDAKLVARLRVLQTDRSLPPANMDNIHGRIIAQTKLKDIFLFERTTRKKSYRVTVRRFRIHMPDSQRLTTTVWWATEIIVADCSVQN